MRARKCLLSIILILITLTVSSCKKYEETGFNIGQYFYYLPAGAGSTAEWAEANKDAFIKLEDYSTKNLQHLLGTKGHFVWIRAEFELPEDLKNQTLGLVIPYLRMAGQLYINNTFVAQDGKFPPHEQSSFYQCHYFNLPVDTLNQHGKNVILIKVWSHGQSAISYHSYIKPSEQANKESFLINFIHSRVYLMFEGGLFFTFVLYLLMFICKPDSPENLDFSLLAVCTIFFLTPFFSPEVPWYNAFPFLLFIKVTLSVSFYWMFYFITSFIFHFEHTRQNDVVKYLRLMIVVAQTVFTMILPSYDSLMAFTVPMLLISILQLSLGLAAFLHNLFLKHRRREAIIQFVCFIPALGSILADLILRLSNPTQIFPFITLFGWQLTIIIFMIVLALRIARLYRQNERLSHHLQDEVNDRTLELQTANSELSHLNERLEIENARSETDLEMASIVQKKFFPPSQSEFTGWDLSICYQPLSKVSGDLYDYYTFNDTLNGFSLFDVSGHGISASLITMLSKNIISRIFQKGFREKSSIPDMLVQINDQINKEKGSIDNYLTGIICRMGNFNADDSVDIQMGNAGHPYPYLYSSTGDQVLTLMPSEEQEHCGAIGMQGVQVTFPQINFTMYEDDVLVCFTDGLTEMTNIADEQFGRERIEQIIQQNHKQNATHIMLALKTGLKEFTGKKEWSDDLTIVVLKRRSSSAPVFRPDIEELFSE